MVPKGNPSGGQHYGESVKRHLDIFDLEASLNEVRCTSEFPPFSKIP